MNIAKFSVKNSKLVNLVTILIYVLGTLALLKLPKDILPQISFDVITITSTYPGTSAEDMEKLVTSPIEEAIKNIKDIKKITSVSFEGLSSITVELKTSADKDEVYNDIQTAIDSVNDLPDDMDNPTITKAEIEIPVIRVSLAGNISEKEKREYADDLSDELKSISGVSSILKSGYREREIWVEVNPAKLVKNEIDLSTIISVINLKNVSIPGGKADAKNKEYLIKTTGEIKEADDVKRIILRANDDGNYLTVGDVAKVNDTFEKIDTIHKSMGYRDISLLVQKNEESDATKIAKSVRKVVEQFKKRAPQNLKIFIMNDTSVNIKSRINILTSNSIMGFILVFITLLLFMNNRVAILTALGIPFSLFATFAVMSYAGMTINMISLFGFILVLGMLVDDGIVITENSYRYLEEGMLPKEAAIKGTTEVIGPVIASVLTTIAAFYPLLIMGGTMGKFMKDIPLIIIIALSASILEAFFVLPSHIADFVKPLKSRQREKDKKKNSIKFLDSIKHHIFTSDKKGSESKWYQNLLKFYKRLLNFTLHNRYKFIAGVTLLFIASILLAAFVMRFQLFTSSSIDEFRITVEAVPDASLEYTEKIVSQIENIIKKLPSDELESFESIIGTDKISGGGRSSLFLGNQYNNRAALQVYLTSEDKRERKASQIIAYLKKRISHINGIEKVTFRPTRRGPPVGNPVEIEVHGDNFDKIYSVAQKIERILSKIKGVIDIENDYNEGKEEVNVLINEKKASIAGVNIAQVGSIIRTAFQGTEASRFRQNNELVKIIVKFDEEHSKTLENLKKIYIPNRMGQMVPLKAIADFKIRRSIKVINRIDLKRTITVSADVDKKFITSKKANKIAKQKVKNELGNISGISIKFAGEEEATRESMVDLGKAFIIALFLIYIILAVILNSFIQPFIVMIAIPFGVIGVILALIFHNMPIEFFSLMGIVALSGVVVNESIVLIDLINILRKKSSDIHNIVIQAGMQRMRPVLLTTITTAAGLFSMAYGIGGTDPMLQPLALSFMWGLMFATFLTLILVPTVYMIYNDIAHKSGRVSQTST